METKTAALVVLIGLGAAGLLGALLTFLKPQSTREAEAVTAPAAASFPARTAGAAAPASAADEPASKLPAPDEWNLNTRVGGGQQGGSLTFVRGGGGMSGGAGADQASAEAAKAAAEGDAKGVMAGLQQESDKGGRKATRAVMQTVVDTVHRLQPSWYKEFLANKQLKAVADTYDKGLDFGAFVRQLAQSPAFKGMLKRRANTSALRTLTTKLLTDPKTGPKLEELFFQNAKDPEVIDTVKQFGPGAGLPADLLQFVGAGKKTMNKPKLNVGGGKPSLQPRGFGQRGGFGNKQAAPDPSAGGDANGGLPEGVDPAMLEKYQKYMKK